MRFSKMKTDYCIIVSFQTSHLSIVSYINIIKTKYVLLHCVIIFFFYQIINEHQAVLNIHHCIKVLRQRFSWTSNRFGINLNLLSASYGVAHIAKNSSSQVAEQYEQISLPIIIFMLSLIRQMLDLLLILIGIITICLLAVGESKSLKCI